MENSENWKKFKAKATPGIVPLHPSFYESVPTGSRVIDFGCGWGRVSFELYGKGYSVAGVDINENEINWARRHAKDISALESRLQFNVSNVIDLPYKDDSFDAGVMIAIMVNMVNPKNRVKILDEAHRVIQDRGRLYISDFGQTWENESYRKRYEAHFPETKEIGTFIVKDTHGIDGKELYRCHHYTEEEFRTLLGKDFEIDNFQETTITTDSGNTSKGFYISAINKK